MHFLYTNHKTVKNFLNLASNTPRQILIIHIAASSNYVVFESHIPNSVQNSTVNFLDNSTLCGQEIFWNITTLVSDP